MQKFITEFEQENSDIKLDGKKLKLILGLT